MDRKAMAVGFIVTIVLTLVSFLLISGLLVRFSSSSDDIQTELMCHNSILLRSKAMINVESDAIQAEINPVPVLCKTQTKKIRGDRREIMHEIADNMARCWWMFGEGRYEEVLDDSKIQFLPNVFGTQELTNQCFNCYSILINQDSIEGGGPIYAEEFGEFLATETYAAVDLSYLDYFQTYGGPGRVVMTAPLIAPRESYSISMMPKNKGESSVWDGVKNLIGIGPVGLITVGIVASNTDLPENQQNYLGNPTGQAALVGHAVPVIAWAVVVGGGAIIQALRANSAYKNIMAEIYSERDVSSIYLGFLEVGEERCGSGDLAGE